MEQRIDPSRLRYPPQAPLVVTGDRSYRGRIQSEHVLQLVFTIGPLALLIFADVHRLPSDWRTGTSVLTVVFALLLAAAVRAVVRRLRSTVTVGPAGISLRRGRRTAFAAGWDDIADVRSVRLVIKQAGSFTSTVISDEKSVYVLHDNGTEIELGHLGYLDGLEMINVVQAWWQKCARPPGELTSAKVAAKLRLRSMTPLAWTGFLTAISISVAATVGSIWLAASKSVVAYLGLTLVSGFCALGTALALLGRLSEVRELRRQLGRPR